jgi:hypothetical protein
MPVLPRGNIPSRLLEIKAPGNLGIHRGDRGVFVGDTATSVLRNCRGLPEAVKNP